MTAVANDEHGLIKDPAFAQAIVDYRQHRLDPRTPVAIQFASCLEVNRWHPIASCETCYEMWRALT
jgi:hypothetical protein